MPSKRSIPATTLLAIVSLFVTHPLPAQHPEVAGHWGTPLDKPLLPDWQAQWIWLPEDADADMLLARKSFTLPDIPDRATLSITATSRYQLFVNGKYIAFGPARSAPHHQSFDSLDIEPALQKGTNVVAVRVHYQRDDVSYYDPSRAGLLAQLDHTINGQDTTVPSDTSWQVSPDESWLNTSPRMARFHLEVCDRVDLRKQAKSWTELDFEDSAWPKARVLQRKTGWPLPQPDDRPTHLIPPWTTLVPRGIPYLVETTHNGNPPVHIASVPDIAVDEPSRSEAWADAPAIPRIPVPPIERRTDQTAAPPAPLVIPANQSGQCRVLVYDLNEVRNSRPFLDIKGPAGTVVDIMSAPYLLDKSIRSPIVVSDYVDRIVLSGNRDRWQAFYMKPARWLAVVFRHLSEEATLYKAGVVQQEYPFQQKGFFQTPDAPELEAFWQAAGKTIRVCTTDAFTDNYRERRQYAQTAYYACLGNYPLFGDFALQRRYLTQIAEEQLANGIMPAYAPRHGDDYMVILDSNCFWIRGLHQYLTYSGDRTTTRHLLPAARKLLDLLHSYTNSLGLIDSPPYPYWLDHAVNDRRGANFCLNAHYLGALEDFAQTLHWLNQPDEETYRRRAAMIRQSLRKKLWDPNKQLFADALVNGQLSDHFSEHANAMAMALRIASAEQMEAVAAQLSRNDPHDFVQRGNGITMVTPAMSHFLHAGLCEAGYADESWNLLRARFAHMLSPNTNGTLWEEWWLDATGRNGKLKPIPSGRSDAQTESAFFPGLFTRYILGIEPTQPGLEEVELHYYDSKRLLQRRGAIPTPTGLLEVAWSVNPAACKITLHIPTATTVKLNLASLNVHTADAVTIDNRPVLRSQIQDGLLALRPGDHTVRVKRQ